MYTYFKLGKVENLLKENLIFPAGDFSQRRKISTQ